ncbi:unnamed protein product [Triticum turgidum subsp. durum]|uniref:CobQ/CobB/MinD/ParA nucleotide binding domain-containing protein n=2 Tax=Triticum TaxID=4564 RepID=A0A9R0SQJ6_TRITD|nr:unnamed protein product [Triticum turgidum subsp. durum]
MAFPPRLLLPPRPPSPSPAPARASARPSGGGGRTAPELSGPTPRVVVVTSGKGGVGKTTTTANLAASLARLGLPVVAVDADAGLRNLDLLLGLENRVNLTAADVLAGDCRLDQALVRHRSLRGLHLLCLSKPRSKLPLAFGSKTLTWVADALRRGADPPAFILIDCPAGVDAGFVTAIAPAEEAVLVTTPDITALRDADRVAGLLECDGIKDIKIIVNRVRPDLVRGEDMMSALDVQEMLGLPLLGLALEQATWRLVERDAMTAVMVEEQERPKKKGGFFSFFGG